MAQLIVALDVPTPDEAERLIDELYELDVIYKIGMESLYAYGERIFSYMEARDVRYFIDAKLHDIPRTVAAAITQLVRHGTHIVNVHALGGRAMMEAAVSAAHERAARLGISQPNVFAVTILTSMNHHDMEDVGLGADPVQATLRLARLAHEAGCDGVICSAHEVANVKQSTGSGLLALTPGIRPAGAAANDQKRSATPAQAVAAGADYLVVGRPITGAADVLSAAKAVLTEMRA